ncbi:STY4851/ECs_5259 family protein [Brucella sp. NBRC 113783]|uniref:STY4851/ECs_5259 family protein n=1 Tax=Brucella sp. NBRC 113783 TaxID=3075478 RepID=UPI0029BFD87C|nr:STY4851/ECs_5259 family protein [Brucella sp. NBRC 113783]MDX4074006.1 STY4851/ECs_5259 family protein [Brucella sp. NBRC 113783]
MRLKELSDHDLRAEFDRSRDDMVRLEEISGALKPRSSDDAIELHMEVLSLLRRLRKASSSSTPPAPKRHWNATFLLKRGLHTPDGRPLHQYRMTDQEYAELRESLRVSTRRLLQEDGAAASMFVAFCAEWFRREAMTLFLKWDSVAIEILRDVPDRTKRNLTRIGIGYWKRRLIRSETSREFLLTLALEGGISAHLLADGGSTWLADYLRTIMRFALTGIDREHIRGFAHDMSWKVPISYRQEGFVDLCCELIVELVKWRKALDQAPSNIDPVRYLDAHSPDWKESLPIYMSAEHDEIARKLLGGLLNEKVGAISGSGIGADRYLCFDGEKWQPALLLNAEGEVPASRMAAIPLNGRWKASPSGSLANFLPSQIALFEPPVEGSHAWRVRPLVSLGKLIVGFPLNESVMANLTCGSEAISVVWPKGAPVTSQIATFIPDEGSDPAQPRKMRLAKTGSASLPPPLVYVLVPTDWNATAAEGTALGQTWSVDNGHTLHAVSGTVYFARPGAATGEHYRVEAGKDERQESLEILSSASTAIHTDDEFELCEGSVSFKIALPVGSRQPRRGELQYRRLGDVWKPVPDGRLSEHGLFDVSWRDPVADIQLERRRIAILPAGAKIQGRMTSATEGVITFESLPNWNVELSGDMNLTEQSAEGLKFSFVGKPRYKVAVILRTSGGQSLSATVTLRGREASIILSDGKVAAAGQEIDITALRGAIAVSPHTTTLTVAPRVSKSNSLQFKFADEFPLSALKRVMEEFIAQIGDQDAVLELDFLGDSRKPICLKQYRYRRPSKLDGAVVFSSEFTEQPVARMIMNPEREHLLRATADGAYEIPDWCRGPCLVYLRDGPDVVSRPLLVHLQLDQAPRTPLQSALAQQEFPRLVSELQVAVDLLIKGQLPTEDVRFLVELVCSLNGLPASAFEVLKQIALQPRALLRLLLSAATDGERQAIWNLQEQLPFLWLTIPSSAWEEAFITTRDALESALSILPEGMRQTLLIDQLKSMRASVLALEPGLDRVFVKFGFPETAMPTLEDVLQNFVREQRMFDDDTAISAKRRDPVLEQVVTAGIRLPTIFHNFSVGDFDGVVAPVALAAASRGMLKITLSSDILLRKALREHGRYVSFAYAHIMRHFEVTH